MSVQRAQAEISSSEFSEWMEFFQANPPGDLKREYEAAHICYQISRVFGGNKNAKIEDFVLKYNTHGQRKLPTMKELKAKVSSWLSFEKGKRR